MRGKLVQTFQCGRFDEFEHLIDMILSNRTEKNWSKLIVLSDELTSWISSSIRLVVASFL